jgi:pimeloyl-ACP methyl ester carboxylesterase
MATLYSEGLALSAVLTIPSVTRPTAGFPAVALAQGLSGIKSVIMPEIASAYAAAGIATLAFDYRGCGESAGDPHIIRPLDRVDDIRAAVAYLRSHRDIDATRVGLYGVSYGASQALYAAAVDDGVRCVAAVSGAIDGIDFLRGLRSLEEWIGFKDRLREDRARRALGEASLLVPVSDVLPFSAHFFERYKAIFAAAATNDSAPKPPATIALECADAMIDFAPSAVAHRLAGRPSLVIQGDRDDVMAVEDVLACYERIPSPKEFVMMNGCDHIDLDGGPAHDKQVAITRDWFKATL